MAAVDSDHPCPNFGGVSLQGQATMTGSRSFLDLMQLIEVEE